MRLGLAAWGLRETPLEEQLTLTRQLGVDVLELGIINSPGDLLSSEVGARELEAVRRLFARHGRTPLCAATGNDFTLPDPEQCRAGLAAARKAVTWAGALKIKYLRIFAGFIPKEELTPARRELLLSCLSEVAEAAKECGVTLALETHGGVVRRGQGVLHTPSVATDPGTLDWMLEAVPDLRLCFDPANLHAVGMAPVKFYRHYRDRIVTMHLKDFIRNPDGTLRPGACGDGGLAWPELQEAVTGFDGPALIEYEIPFDVADGMRRSLDFLHGNQRMIGKESA